MINSMNLHFKVEHPENYWIIRGVYFHPPQMMGHNHRNQTKVHLREHITLLILTVNGDVVQDSHQHDPRR